MTSKRIFGLIGYPLEHSFSPGYFKNKFEKENISDAEYLLFELENIEQYKELTTKKICGLNVTIPYKEKVLPFLDELSNEAREIGAVNTIKFEKGKTIGYNTDTFGFEKSLKNFYGNNKPERALVLGSGGASKAVGYTLQKMEIDFQIVSRKNKYLNYKELDESYFEGRILIVNTTPLGTFPDVDEKPGIPYKYITNDHYLFDLVYNPEKTLFLSLGEKRGASIKNGYEMLELQADKSWEIWNT